MHTVAVMQSADNLRRVAREFVEDLATDGVVYGETRWAPEQHVEGGLTPAQTVEAVRDGLDEGMAAAAAVGHPIVVRQLVTAMRHNRPSREIANLAIDYREDGVAGFDIAGAEAGYPPTRYLDAFDYLKRNNAFFTIHAGEAFGLPSIWEAVQICGANRLATGCGSSTTSPSGRTASPNWVIWPPTSGTNASPWRCARRPTCTPVQRPPSPSTRSVCCASSGFHVTVNSDNQLMSRTTLSREFALLCEAFDYTLDDVRWFTINAAKSAFYPFDVRLRLIEDVIKPGFAALGAPG